MGGGTVLLLLFSVWQAKRIDFQRGKYKTYALAVLFLILNLALLGRTHDNFVSSIYLETRHYQSIYADFIHEKESRGQNLTANLQITSDSENGIYVLVIGESENRDHMSAFGYNRETTPWLDSMKNNPQMLFFPRAYANYVATVQALTYALTAKNQYNNLVLKDAVSLIEMAKAAGYETVWLSNQVKYGSYGAAVTVLAQEADQQIWLNDHLGDTLDINYLDGELVNRLQAMKPTKRMLIIVHLMGNHNSYIDRYPNTFNRFGSGRVNEYDNSVYYNDDVMHKLLDTVKAWPNFMGLIYFSDHGEDVHKGHNPGNFDFDMARIPLYMYFSPTYIKEHPQRFEDLKQAQGDVFTNDLIFNTVLGVMGIHSPQIDEPQNDLSNSAYNKNPHRFYTLHGGKMIMEDLQN